MIKKHTYRSLVHLATNFWCTVTNNFAKRDREEDVAHHDTSQLNPSIYHEHSLPQALCTQHQQLQVNTYKILEVQ